MSIRLLAFCETDCARIEQRYVDGQPVLPGNENERSDSHSPRPGADGSGSPQRLKQILGVVALLVTIAGGAKALWPHHTSAVTAYRNKLEKEVCLGDLAAAARSNNPSVYASEDGAIDKGAWLSAMDNTRNHLKQGLDRFRSLEPPHSLRSDRDAALAAWVGLNGYWDEYRTYTATLRSSQLTVFDYPGPTREARNVSEDNAFGVPMAKLMGQQCSSTTSGARPAAPRT